MYLKSGTCTSNVRYIWSMYVKCMLILNMYRINYIKMTSQVSNIICLTYQFSDGSFQMNAFKWRLSHGSFQMEVVRWQFSNGGILKHVRRVFKWKDTDTRMLSFQMEGYWNTSVEFQMQRYRHMSVEYLSSFQMEGYCNMSDEFPNGGMSVG